MSTIQIQFTAIDLGNGGFVDIGFNDNVIVTQLKLTSINGPTQYLRFSEIPSSAPSDPNAAQAQAYAYSFNRDFKNVGGANNLSAVSVGNVVTITAVVGTFDTFAKTGNFATNLGISNSPQSSEIVFTVTQSAVGDCTSIQYSATATGGTPPYVLYHGSVIVDAAWNGASQNFNLTRGQVRKVSCSDSLGALKETTVIVSRKLSAGDFSIQTQNFSASSDILVIRDVTIAGTAPLQYSLDNTTEITGQNYQAGNAFAGVAAGTYNLFIKDQYDCEVLKVIQVTGFQDNTELEKIRYFEVMEGQSFIFSESPDFDDQTKKTYFNTLSWNFDSLVKYPIIQKFNPNDPSVGTQFKSSYEYHNITLHGCDGSTRTLEPIMIKKNLGATEKVDCVLFPIETDPSKTGVYFNGGDAYVPDTTTVDPTGTVYSGFAPLWATIGQLVFIEGSGGFYITDASYDPIIGDYFVIDLTTPSQVAGIVQATYNIQPYNLFEFYLDISTVPDRGFIVIEKSFEQTGPVEGNPWISEIIQKVVVEDDLLIEWSDSKNKADIVFQSGIKFRMRIKGEFMPEWEDEADTQAGDSRKYNIEQKHYQGFSLLVEPITAKQVTQLSIAAVTEGFAINNINLLRDDAPEISRLGKSNLWKWKCAFAYGENRGAIQEDQVVLSVGTGVVGGGTTGENPDIDLNALTLYRDSSGNLITKDGNLITE